MPKRQKLKPRLIDTMFSWRQLKIREMKRLLKTQNRQYKKKRRSLLRSFKITSKTEMRLKTT